MLGETTPTPVVLEFVEGVFAVGPVPVELGDAEDFVGERGHPHGVFVDQGAPRKTSPTFGVERRLLKQGSIARGGPIIDAILAPAPRQHFTKGRQGTDQAMCSGPSNRWAAR